MTCFISLVKDGGNVSSEELILKIRADNLSLKRFSSCKICKMLKHGVAAVSESASLPEQLLMEGLWLSRARQDCHITGLIHPRS